MRKENYKFFKFFIQKEISPITRTVVSSLIVILFFYTAPVLVNIAKIENMEFQNNSKKILAYTLNNKDNLSDNDNKILNEKDLSHLKF